MKTLHIKLTNVDINRLAEQADISVNTARALSRGYQRRVDFDVLERVAHALKVSPLDLFEVRNPEPVTSPHSA